MDTRYIGPATILGTGTGRYYSLGIKKTGENDTAGIVDGTPCVIYNSKIKETASKRRGQTML